MPLTRSNRKLEPCHCGDCRSCTPDEYEDEDILAECEDWDYQRELREHEEEEKRNGYQNT